MFGFKVICWALLFIFKLNGSAIKRVKSFKCLGVYVDEFLTWESHIENISKKVAKGLGVLRRLRSFVPKSILITIYNSLIVPHLDYCSSVWGSIGKGLSNKIQKLQNRAARIITHSSYDIRSKDILNDLGCEEHGRKTPRSIGHSNV